MLEMATFESGFNKDKLLAADQVSPLSVEIQ